MNNQSKTNILIASLLVLGLSACDTEAPKFTSNASTSVDENQLSAITLVATDNNSTVNYSINSGDASSFSVNATTGVVTFNTAPDFETKDNYSFNAVATDASANEASQKVTINILDVDETVSDTTPPTFTSNTSVSVNENQLSAITLVATDNNSTVTYSINSGDASDFSVDATSGVVTFNDPHSGTKDNYSFNAVATDASGNEAFQTVTIYTTDKDFFWMEGTWSECIGDCGTDNATQTREVMCVFEYISSDGTLEYWDASLAGGSCREATKPATTQSCTARACSLSVIKKTLQAGSYGIDGKRVTDNSLKDDGYYQKGVTPDYTRAGDMVTDELTGLMWQDNTVVKKPWLTSENNTTCTNDTNSSACYNTSGDTATSYCSDLTLGGYIDWRLPTVKELMDISTPSKYNPAIDTTYFTNTVVSRCYWSSTTHAGNSNNAWRVCFLFGAQYNHHKSDSHYVRCVRAGQ